MDDIDQEYWRFVRIFEKYTVDTEDYLYMSWSLFVSYP